MRRYLIYCSSQVSRQHWLLPGGQSRAHCRTCRVGLEPFRDERLFLNLIRDTRVLLTSTDAGRVTPLTENHHAEARVESVRLRRMMGGLATDSFGEVR